MKRYFDLHDKKKTAVLSFTDNSKESKSSVGAFKSYLNSDDIREITLSQYRRLTVQYES